MFEVSVMFIISSRENIKAAEGWRDEGWTFTALVPTCLSILSKSNTKVAVITKYFFQIRDMMVQML